MRIIHDRWVLRDEFWISILYASFQRGCYINKLRRIATAPTLHHLLPTIMLMVSHTQQWHVFLPQSCRQSLQWPCRTAFALGWKENKTGGKTRILLFHFKLQTEKCAFQHSILTVPSNSKCGCWYISCPTTNGVIAINQVLTNCPVVAGSYLGLSIQWYHHFHPFPLKSNWWKYPVTPAAAGVVITDWNVAIKCKVVEKANVNANMHWKQVAFEARGVAVCSDVRL